MSKRMFNTPLYLAIWMVRWIDQDGTQRDEMHAEPAARQALAQRHANGFQCWLVNPAGEITEEHAASSAGDLTQSKDRIVRINLTGSIQHYAEPTAPVAQTPAVAVRAVRGGNWEIFDTDGREQVQRMDEPEDGHSRISEETAIAAARAEGIQCDADGFLPVRDEEPRFADDETIRRMAVADVDSDFDMHAKPRSRYGNRTYDRAYDDRWNDLRATVEHEFTYPPICSSCGLRGAGGEEDHATWSCLATARPICGDCSPSGDPKPPVDLPICCPECGCNELQTQEIVLATCDLTILPDGDVVRGDGTEVDWNTQSVLTNSDGHILVECASCKHTWPEPRLKLDEETVTSPWDEDGTYTPGLFAQLRSLAIDLAESVTGPGGGTPDDRHQRYLARRSLAQQIKALLG
jgi:hypothetical protein